jgi:hypothetical protein
MLETIALISVLSAVAFLSLAYGFRKEISEAMRPPQRVPVPVRIDEEVRRKQR